MFRERGRGETTTVRSNRLENCPIADAKQFIKQAWSIDMHFYDKSSGTLVVQWNENAIFRVISNQQGMLPIKKVEKHSAAENKESISTHYFLAMTTTIT